MLEIYFERLKKMMSRSRREGSNGKINGEKDGKCREYWEEKVG